MNTVGISIDNKLHMQNIHDIRQISEKAIEGYRRDFDQITMVNERLGSIKLEYATWKNHADHWDLQSRYSDYCFLSHLSDFERNRLIFAYSIIRYIRYLDEIEGMKLWKEYLLRLQFDLDSEVFLGNGVVLFPSIAYHVANAPDWKIRTIEWHEDMEFWRHCEQWRSYFEKIMDSLEVRESFDLSDYYFCDSFEISVDLNLPVSKFKKRIATFYPIDHQEWGLIK